MPTFIVLGHRVSTDGKFTLNDLAGSTGRLDILLRCVNAAFFLSNDLRRDVDIHLILLGEPDPPKTIRLVGSELKYLNPDERSTGALIRNALMQKLGNEEVRSTPGIYVSRKGLKEILESCKGRPIVYLREAGLNIREFVLTPNFVFVLGGQFDLSEEEENIVFARDPILTSLGPKKLHASHCITVALNELDSRK